MNLRDYVEIAFQEPAFRFLIIGGCAVAAHGHGRATFDVDFLACNEDREQWRQRLQRHQFQVVCETSSFAQFSPPDRSTGLDVMFVAAPTFEQFWAAAEERKFETTAARFPSLDHLLALKLHVLRQGLGHRTCGNVGETKQTQPG